MGRAAQDGAFSEFQAKVLGLAVTITELDVTVQSLRGEEIAFGWSGPLLVNGEEQSITDFNHYENPFCTSALGDESMMIRSWHHAMQLDFSASE